MTLSRYGAGLVLLAVVGIANAAAPQYTQIRSVPLGPPTDWDFVHYDPVDHHVYVAHETQVTVVDGDSGKLIGRVLPIAGAHGIVTIPKLGHGYADDGESGEVTVFDLRTLKTLGHIPADKDADAMAYDAASGRIAVGNGDSRDISIIDPKAGKRLTNIALDGGPEGIIADGNGTLYVNIEDKRQIARIDLASEKITARWPVPTCKKPHGLAIDTRNHRLFSSCENRRLLVIDTDNGKVVDTLPIGRGTDTAVYDPKRHLIFSSNKDATLSVIAQKSADYYVFLGNVKTAPHAGTMAEDVDSGRIFTTTATVTATHPPHHPGGAPDFTFKPGTARLLMFDPVAP